MSRWRSTAPIALGLAILLASCGPPEPPPPEPDPTPPRRWEFDPWPLWDPETQWEGFLPNPSRVLDLSAPDAVVYPSARNAVGYRRVAWEGRHLVLALSASGTVAGHGAIDADATGRSLLAARNALVGTAGESPPVLIRTPGHTPWSVVAALLSRVRSDDLVTDRFQIELAQSFHQARRMDLRVSDLGAAGGDRVDVRLSGLGVGDRHWVRVTAAEQRFEFPAALGVFDPRRGGGYEARRFFDELSWKVQQALDEARGAGRAARVEVVETEGAVPFAYVVNLLDVLIDAGYRTASFPDLGSTFHVEPAPPDRWPDPPPALPTWVLLASALAIVLVFSITIASVGRTRRRQRAFQR